jgi:hypothetical protein
MRHADRRAVSGLVWRKFVRLLSPLTTARVGRIRKAALTVISMLDADAAVGFVSE